MKKLLPSDIKFVENKVHKTFNLNTGSDGVSTVTFQSGSSNSESSSYYNSLNGLFYQPHYHTTNWDEIWCYGSINKYSSFFPKPQYKHKFNDTGVVYDIQKKYYGDQIKPGSFTITENSLSTSVTIKDDNYGNLYASDATLYNDITSGTPSSSISSSANYVGNIFYEQGLVVLTETGSYVNNYWDLDNSGYETSSLDMSDQNTAIHGIAFKPDGTKYFVVGRNGGSQTRGVYEYVMSTAWDVSTATYTGTYLNLDTDFTANDWNSISFNPDGTRMFLTNQDNKNYYSFHLPIAWDLSSWVHPGAGNMERFSIDGLENNVQGHYFRDDGLKLYIIGAQNHSAQEYNFSSAFDLTTLTDVSQSFNVSASMAETETEFFGIHFKPDGTRMYTMGNDRDMVYEHRLSTGWDVSTATFHTSMSIDSSLENILTDVHWKPDGSKMYVVGTGRDKVHQYQHSASLYSDLGTNFEIEFDSTVTVFSYEYRCKLRNREYNSTFNPTILRDELGTVNLDRYTYRPHEPNTETGSTGNKNREVSMSVPVINSRVISKKFLNENFRTYITEIGFYNDKNQLLMVASLPEPLQKPKNRDIVIKVQMDF
tara:strand:- start:200 stop:1984 length:1785 start_codon:yes stop_codon:yes gene_type:complete